MANTLIESIIELTEPVILSEGMELIDIDYRQEPRGWVLRFYIDKEGGVTLLNCSRISSQLGSLLEVKDIIPHRYVLEVSSPGLNRPLKKEEDFIAYAGETIKVTTLKPIEQRRNFSGILQGFKDGKVMLSADNQEILIPFPLIAKANIQYRFPETKTKRTKCKKA